jgi:hypothetical protein
MPVTETFHLIYRPADAKLRITEAVTALVQTSDPDEVRLHLHASPGSESMLLDAECLEEALSEAKELGFCC